MEIGGFLLRHTYSCLHSDAFCVFSGRTKQLDCSSLFYRRKKKGLVLCIQTPLRKGPCLWTCYVLWEDPAEGSRALCRNCWILHMKRARDSGRELSECGCPTKPPPRIDIQPDIYLSTRRENFPFALAVMSLVGQTDADPPLYNTTFCQSQLGIQSLPK